MRRQRPELQEFKYDQEEPELRMTFVWLTPLNQACPYTAHGTYQAGRYFKAWISRKQGKSSSPRTHATVTRQQLCCPALTYIVRGDQSVWVPRTISAVLRDAFWDTIDQTSELVSWFENKSSWCLPEAD